MALSPPTWTKVNKLNKYNYWRLIAYKGHLVPSPHKFYDIYVWRVSGAAGNPSNQKYNVFIRHGKIGYKGRVIKLLEQCGPAVTKAKLNKLLKKKHSKGYEKFTPTGKFPTTQTIIKTLQKNDLNKLCHYIEPKLAKKKKKKKPTNKKATKKTAKKKTPENMLKKKKKKKVIHKSFKMIEETVIISKKKKKSSDRFALIEI